MPKEQTEKSRYPSRFSPGKFVAAAQYITEIICEKKARTMYKELPTRFWEIEEWKKYYRQQIPAANKLLKTFPAAAIISALKDNKTAKTYSLRAPFLVPVIKSYLNKNNKIPKLFSVFVKPDDCNEKPKTSYGKPSLLSKLRSLDGEEEI